MRLFKKKIVAKTYDKENKKPVIKASICNGEQVLRTYIPESWKK